MTETIYALTAFASMITVIIVLIILLMCIRRLKPNRRRAEGANLAVVVSAMGKALEAGGAESKRNTLQNRRLRKLMIADHEIGMRGPPSDSTSDEHREFKISG